MRHLTREELLALAEGTRHDDPHVTACARCRDEVAWMRAMRREFEQVDVPEPSPLFWENLSARIGATLADGRRRSLPRPDSWGRWFAWAVPLTAAVGLAVLTVRVGHRQALRPEPAVAVVAARGDEDAGWDLVREAISEEETGIVYSLAVVDPGSSDRLVPDLSTDERTALLLLLQAELGASRPQGPDQGRRER